jgi:hypothetical protein
MACKTGKENTPKARGGRVFCIIRICIVFCIVFVFLAPATRDRCGGRKRDGASCLGCTHGTWLYSMSNSIIYHVSCYRFVSQHTYVYHIGPHAHVDTASDSRQQQQPPAPAPAVAQIIQNNTKSRVLYYVLYVLIVLCIMYFRSLVQNCRRTACRARRRTDTQSAEHAQRAAAAAAAEQRQRGPSAEQLRACKNIT